MSASQQGNTAVVKVLLKYNACVGATAEVHLFSVTNIKFQAHCVIIILESLTKLPT